ncbi:MAG: methylmalonyl-CoA epimerase [Candidatus Aminicenantaceae bacterium]
MKIKKIDHIGIAVKNLDESLKRWENITGAKRGVIEEIRERGVKVALLEFESGPSVELVTSMEKDSPVEKFLEKRGEGIHHFSFVVEEIEECMAELKKKGVQFIQEKPQRGAEGSFIAFLHPDNLNGVLIELKEKKS